MGMRKVWTIAAAAAVCTALVLMRQKPVQYRCAAVEVREIAVCVEAVGTVNFAQTRALNVFCRRATRCRKGRRWPS